MKVVGFVNGSEIAPDCQRMLDQGRRANDGSIWYKDSKVVIELKEYELMAVMYALYRESQRLKNRPFKIFMSRIVDPICEILVCVGHPIRQDRFIGKEWVIKQYAIKEDL